MADAEPHRTPAAHLDPARLARLRERVLSGFPEESDVDELVRPLTDMLAGETFVVSDLRRVGQPVVHVAPGFVDLTGYAPTDAVGRDLGFLLRNDTDQDAVRDVREAIRDGRATTVTLRNYRADGTLFWCEQRHHPLRDVRGRTGHVVTVLRDVTDQVNARSAEEAARQLVGDLGPDGGWFAYGALVDASGRVQITWVGDSCRAVLGAEAATMVAGGLLERVHPDDREGVLARWRALRLDGGSRRDRYRIVRGDGRMQGVEDFAAVSWSAAEAGVVALHGVVRAVGAHHADAATAIEAGDVGAAFKGVDAGTGLPTREVAEDRLQQAARHARRHGRVAAAVAIVLDHFDFVHATMDPRRGERLVREAARRLQRALRRSDTLSRIDRGTFLAVLSDLEAPDAALPVVEKLLAWVARPFDDGSLRVELSASAGVAIAPLHARPAEVFAAAEEAVAAAQRAGGGRFAFADPELDAAARVRAGRERALHTAFAEDQFVLHYQPRVRLDGDGVTGVEGLVRWNHPTEGLLPPASFLPDLERARLGDALFERVLDRATRQAARWYREGTPRRVAVNVGPEVLEREDLARLVHRALDRASLHPGLLELEIHERTGRRTWERGAGRLRELRAMGVHVALDDFGAADTNLSQLRELPLDALKIDRAFVARIETGSRRSADLELLRAMITLGRGLGLTVVAEGVETAVQRDHLRDLACDEAQGFLYAPARPADEAFPAVAALPN
jgi:PAS domain S-box-containing protein/diguanylate cyclase (GGDEF)-like protein